MYLLGNNYSDNFTYFEISFSRWVGQDSKGNVCKSSTDIDNALNKASLAMAVVNTYYDFDDYNTPVKTYFDDQFYYDFVAEYEKEADVYVSQSSVEQKDSYFRYAPKGVESNFISKLVLLNILNYYFHLNIL